jgi:hypothetical protein
MVLIFVISGVIKGKTEFIDWAGGLFIYHLALYWFIPFCMGTPMSQPYQDADAIRGKNDTVRLFLLAISLLLGISVLAN